MRRTRPTYRPNAWVDRWDCASDYRRDWIRERQRETQRFPLVRVVSVDRGVETYECGHRAAMKLGPDRKPYPARHRRCVECRVVDLAFAALLTEVGLGSL